MAITVSGGKPQFTDDNSSAKITSIYHNPDRVWALVGPSSYLIAGSSASLSAQKAANPTFRVVRLEDFLMELLASTDLTSQRLAQVTPGNYGR